MNYNDAISLHRPLNREELEQMFCRYVGRLCTDIIQHIETAQLTKVLCHVVYKKLREERGLDHRHAILRLHQMFGVTERSLYNWFREHQGRRYRQVFVVVV